MTSLEIIKDELAKIEKDEDHILAGRQGNMIKYLSKALSVAVEALSGYQEGCMVDKKFIPNDAMSAINTIANILRSASVSGSKDGK